MRTALIAGGVILCLALGWIFREDVSAPSKPGVVPTAPLPSPVATGRPVDPGTSSRTAAKPTAPLPPRDTPVAQILEPLKLAAAAGDAPAACRLAMEIVRCARWRREVANLVSHQRERFAYPPEMRSRVDNHYAELQRRIDKERPVCEGLPAQSESPWRLLLTAARAGHVPSMVQFSGTDVVRSRYNDTEWEFEALAAYREYAFGFLVKGAETGDPRAIQHLAVELVTPGPGTRAIPYDPVRGYAYLKALSGFAESWRAKMMEEQLGSIRARLGPLDQARAEALSFTILSREATQRLRGASLEAPGPETDFGCRQ